MVTAATLAHAQEPEQPPLEDGQVVWAFAQESPLFDERVAGALGTLMAPLLESEPALGTPIVRVQFFGPDFEAAHIYPANDVPPLLDAAGFGNAPPFVEVGQCRYWASSQSPAGAAPAIAGALHEALASLGVETQACVVTQNPDEAQLLIWIHGEAAPTPTQRDGSSFLAGNSPPPPDGSATNQGPDTDAPGPPQTGSGGLLETGTSDVPVVLMAVVAAAGLLAAATLMARQHSATGARQRRP
jgi:hypothetical protein